MARSTAWIRNNMLYSEDEYDEQLMEARLKVQRSFQKLSISDWQSHKCSNPSNLVKVTPIESRPPSWKNFKEKSTLYSMNLLDDKKLNEEIKAKVPSRTTISNENYYPKRLSAIKYKECSNCSSKDKMFDTNIPKVKLSKNIYGTYPKTSPSRKVQNINIVLPVRPKVEPLTNQINVNKKNDYSNNSGTPRESRQRKNDAIQISDMVTTPIRTPDVKSSFKIPATSTPKFSRAYLFSNIGEDNPKTKKICSQNILEKSYIFENKSMNESDDYKLDNTFKCRKLSKNMLEKASIFDSSLRIENFDQDYKEDIRSYKETPIKTPKENSLLQRNIRSIDSILSKDDYDLTMPKSSSMVRDIAKKLEIASISPSTNESLRTKMNSIFQRKKWNRPNSIIHFLRNKYEHEKKNTIKEMGNLTEKENKSSLSRQNYNTRVNQNVVKQLVNVIEKEIVPKVKTYHQSLKRNFVCEEDSFSESEAKSVVTSTSPKDTDSSSDTDQKSLYVNYEQDSFDNENSTTEKTLETEEKVFQDENDNDDDVYWIPVSNPYKFPRTSSLLTISSQISIDTPSPCISPIRMEEEVDVVQKHWRNTTRKVNPFYRIDETIVIDSGYSDKSEAIMNNSESSITDSYY